VQALQELVLRENNVMLKQAQIITAVSAASLQIILKAKSPSELEVILGVIKSYCKAQLENEAVSAASLQIHILEVCLIDSFFLFVVETSTLGLY
jgi:hypothetical protein